MEAGRGWRVDAVIALTSYYLGDVPQARLRAEAAVAAMPEGDPSWNAMAILGIFAEARREAIGAAARRRHRR